MPNEQQPQLQQRNSYYGGGSIGGGGGGKDGASIRSGLLGHGRADSITGSVGGVNSPLASPLEVSENEKEREREKEKEGGNLTPDGDVSLSRSSKEVP